jgi:hypothetical protein
LFAKAKARRSKDSGSARLKLWTAAFHSFAFD